MARRRSSRSRSRGGSRAGGALLFLVGLLVGAGVLWFFLREPSPESPPQAGETEEEGPAPAVNEKPRAAESPRAAVHPSDHVEPEEQQPTATPVRSVESLEPDAPVRGVRVALVIDDLGRSLEDVGQLEALGVPITYAVLPFEEHTAAVVSGLRRARKEMLLHLPMEPKSGAEDPGPGALLLGMSDDELKEKTLAALAAVPGAVGVNNHMGSGLSEDERSMDAVLGVLAGRHLFFLDSRTSAESVGYKTAIRLGIPAAERQVFLDGDPSPDAIRAQFQRLLDLARTRGVAVAIGHPHPETLDVLAEEVPRARALGYEFVPVSYLLNRPGDVE
jgi:polysaccharide deacetylase 2 family uncharacterized protein YibQ